MRGLFSNKYFVLLLVATVLLLFAMAFFTGDREHVSPVEGIVGTIVMPFQRTFSSIGKGVSGFFGHFANIDSLQKQNEELSTQVDYLQNEIRQLEEFKLENERLKAMLGLQDSNQKNNYVGAMVIGWDGSNWYDSFTINKGADDGLAIHLPVVNSKGLVGYISEIAGHWAKVTTLIDPNISLGAAVIRTGDLALIDGDLDLASQGLCKLTYLSKGADLMVGDLIETSGRGGIYPPGLLVGKIREIHPDTKGISQYAIIEPAVDFHRISEVFVVN